MPRELHCEGGHDSTRAVRMLQTFYVQQNPNAPLPIRKTGRSVMVNDDDQQNPNAPLPVRKTVRSVMVGDEEQQQEQPD